MPSRSAARARIHIAGVDATAKRGQDSAVPPGAARQIEHFGPGRKPLRTSA